MTMPKAPSRTLPHHQDHRVIKARVADGRRGDQQLSGERPGIGGRRCGRAEQHRRHEQECGSRQRAQRAEAGETSSAELTSPLAGSESGAKIAAGSAGGSGSWRIGPGSSRLRSAPASAALPAMADRRRRALLNGPFDIGFDRGGNLYFSDTFNHRIRRVEARTGIITTIAGNGGAGYSGDGGPAAGRRSTSPTASHSTAAATSMSPTATITACAGSTPPRASSPPLPATAAPGMPAMAGRPRAPGSPSPTGSASIPTQRHLFIADVADNRVRVVDLALGTIATLAGTGEAAHTGDGGPAAAAGVWGARAVKVAADGHGLYPRAPGEQPARGRPPNRRDHHGGRHRRPRL